MHSLNMKYISITLLLLCFVTPCFAASESFIEDSRRITSAPHRLTGTEAYKEASEYVLQRFREISPDELIVQEYPAAQVEVRKCQLTFENSSEPIELHPLRPNGIIPPVSPVKGIIGRIVHVSHEKYSQMQAQDLKGCIAVADYNTTEIWMRAFRLGARAVIFTREETMYAWHPHHLWANANLPRYYYDGPKSDLTEGTRARIDSEVPWKGVAGRNIFAYFKGTDPVFFQEKEECIVVAANLDSFGEVPTLSKGARGGTNCAGLLRVAEMVKTERPRRNILLAFFDEQARGHGGSSEFYRALEDEQTEVSVEKRKEYLENEKVFISELLEVLSQDNPLNTKSSVLRELVERLKESAKAWSYEFSKGLFELRTERAELEKDSKKYEELTSLIDQKVKQQDLWNDLRRALAKDKLKPEVQKPLDIALEEVRRNIEKRQVELEFTARGLEADEALYDLLADSWISLHVSLLFGDKTSRWGLIIGGDSALHSGDDMPGLYGKIQGTFLKAYRSLEETGKEVENFEVSSADGMLDPPRLLWAVPLLIHSGEVAGKLGIFNLAVGTCQENQEREGTPSDTLDRLDLDKIETQVNEFGRMLVQVASEDGLSLRRSIKKQKKYSVYKFESNKAQGPSVMGRSEGNAMPNKPVPGAILQFVLAYSPNQGPAFRPVKFYAFDNFPVLRSNQNGNYYYGPAHEWFHLGFAAKFDERGQVSETSDQFSWGTFATRMNLFDAKGGYMMMPPQLSPGPASAFKAKGNSVLSNSKSFMESTDGLFSWFCEKKINAVKAFGKDSIVALVNGEETLEPVKQESEEIYTADGIGFPMDGTWYPPNIAARSGGDLWRLNESRMEILRSRDIINNSLEELHGHAEDLLIESKETSSIGKSEALASSANLMERPVYDQSRSTLDDLIKAVLILLALCVPFAYAMERLLIGATNVYRQIFGFTGFFIGNFLILYFTHPAFAVSKTPIIIFLGFAVVVLSSLVIFIIMRKFEVELKVLQGMTTTVHAADVSRFSTVMAAMSMGISTMRRRPLRTALTATTIILLTFTILVFASFGTKMGIVKIFVEASPPYSGVFVHDVNWNELNRSIMDIVGSRWGDEATITTRYWISPRTEQGKGPLLTKADGTEPLALKGVLGIEAEEIALRDDLQALFGNDLENWSETICMSRPVAEHLGVDVGDEVMVGGLKLRVGKLLQGSKVTSTADMDGNGILPVDFVVMQSAMVEENPQRKEEALTQDVQQNWAHLQSDAVVIVSSDNARIMGASLHVLSLMTEDSRSAALLAEELARIFKLSINATRENGVFRHTLGTVVEASGAKDLFFPIILGGLVIFGTMLGSVADREREIYTFSSLGLAPPHVASLFLAEALVYSVLGGMGGYLIAQAIMKLLSFLAGFGLVQVPEINYSSMNAIVTILIVMGTVLVSAIYPAVKASKSANPGILRTWKLPAPIGDVFDIVFPFTVSKYDITGVVSFLKEHFENFGDTGLGVFMAQDAELVQEEDGTLGLDANIALAPFDLGVTQSFEMRSVPSEIEGIDEVRIKLVRKSGQPRDWRRLNKVLLDDLRKQFLIWRSLPEETMEIYRERTLIEIQSMKS